MGRSVQGRQNGSSESLAVSPVVEREARGMLRLSDERGRGEVGRRAQGVEQATSSLLSAVSSLQRVEEL